MALCANGKWMSMTTTTTTEQATKLDQTRPAQHTIIIQINKQLRFSEIGYSQSPYECVLFEYLPANKKPSTKNHAATAYPLYLLTVNGFEPVAGGIRMQMRLATRDFKSSEVSNVNIVCEWQLENNRKSRRKCIRIEWLAEPQNQCCQQQRQ